VRRKTMATAYHTPAPVEHSQLASVLMGVDADLTQPPWFAIELGRLDPV